MLLGFRMRLELDVAIARIFLSYQGNQINLRTEKKVSSRVPVGSNKPAVRSTVGEGRLDKAGEAFIERSF